MYLCILFLSYICIVHSYNPHLSLRSNKNTDGQKYIPRYLWQQLKNYEDLATQKLDACQHPTVYNFQNKKKHDAKFRSKWRLVFDISTLPSDGDMVSAKLHVEWQKHLNPCNYQTQLVGRLKNRKYVIATYEINSTTAALNDTSWNIKKSVSKVLKKQHQQLKFILKIKTPLSECKNKLTFEAFIALELQNNCSDRSQEKHIEKRSIRKVHYSDDAKRIMGNMCQRKPLNINFQDLNWDVWVVAPDGYNAFMCQGTCPYVLSSYLYPSSHSIIQNKMHQQHPEEVPAVCCVPTKLVPMSLIYYDFNGNLVLKIWPDMIVTECGCL